jgi:hypothetical protein
VGFGNTNASRLILVENESFGDILFFKIKNMAKKSTTIPIISDIDFGEHYSDYLMHSEFQIFSRKQKIYIPSQPCVGFSERLNSYFWPTPNDNYEKNKRLLNQYIDVAKECFQDLKSNEDRILLLFKEICKWGGVKLPTNNSSEVISNLVAASAMSKFQVAKMNSACTKLYAIFYPDDFIIYDSRVATSLLSIAETILSRHEIVVFQKKYPALGYVNGRGGTRPRQLKYEWSNAYKLWESQIDANLLCKSICSHLNFDGVLNGSVTLRDLEAVLFMDGY